jgi:hypothetical protein
VVQIALELNSQLTVELQQRVRLLEGMQDASLWEFSPMVRAFSSGAGFQAWRARELGMLRALLARQETLPPFNGQLEVTIERADGLAMRDSRSK